MNLRVLLFLLPGACLLAACGGQGAPLCDDGLVLVDDRCEIDSDGDDVADSQDNCPNVYNPDQADADGDGIGDACEETPPDSDGDGVPDADDNCPNVHNPDQADADGDGIGDACEETPPDSDGDGVPDADDNCPNTHNPDQADADGDGIGDACEEPEGLGTVEDPIIIPVEGDRYVYIDARDTREAPSDRFDSYPPNELDESGPEFVYRFDLDQEMAIDFRIAMPEPEGVDIDLHLLSSIEPLHLISRSNDQLNELLAPGRYYLIMDTYVSAGTELPGPYTLRAEFAVQHAGTVSDPIVIGDPGQALPVPFVFTDSRNTSDATSDVFDTYPPNTADESGPEFIYTFRLDQTVRLTAEIVCPEPEGVDIDLQLLSSLEPLTLLARSDKVIYAELGPGDYFLTLDSYAGLVGPYTLDVSVRPMETPAEQSFRPYILAAVEWIDEHYGRLGYASAVLTHDIAYGDLGVISASAPPRTMCVAATMEVILTAMHLYEDATGDSSIWHYLPQRSFERLGSGDLKAHIWVNYDIYSRGTGDALRHFGMGMTVPFEQLKPGDFINLNRTTGTGHAVTFLAFLDINGLEYESWHEDVIGFKYYSAQGTYDNGGMDYRYAVFSDYGSPSMPYNRDLNVIYSTDQLYLNTGTMYSPDYWLPTSRVPWSGTLSAGLDEDVSVFDPIYFDGRTTDDIE